MSGPLVQSKEKVVRAKCPDCKHDTGEHRPIANTDLKMCPQCYKLCVVHR